MEIFNIRQIAKNKILEKDLDPSVINLLLEHVLGLSNQEILMKNILDLDEDKTSRFFSLLEEYLTSYSGIVFINKEQSVVVKVKAGNGKYRNYLLKLKNSHKS